MIGALFAARPAAAVIRFIETGGGSEYVGFQGPAAITTNLLWTLPAGDGSANQCLATNGSGTLTWATPTAAWPLIASAGASAGAPSYSFNGSATSGMYSPSAGVISFSTAGADRLRITASGGVGIGTTNPQSKLDVNGDIRVGSTATACSAANIGAIQFSSGALQVCNGSAWGAVAAATSGMIAAFPTATCPAAWLPADGSAVSRATYSSLFATIATMYGPGNGTTTFNLPDYRGRFLRGVDGGAGIDPDRASRTNRGDGTTGDAVGTKQADELISHIHQANADGGNNAVTLGGSLAIPQRYASNTSATGGSETRPKNINVTYCVSTGQIASTTVDFSGSGTVNYVPVWTSGTALGNSPIVMNGSDVGIGTAVPSAKLEVNGNAKVTGSVLMGREMPGATSVLVPAGTQRAVVVNCTAGKKITGGGCRSNWYLTAIIENYPSSDTAWYCGAYNNSGTDSTLYAYAICARMEN